MQVIHEKNFVFICVIGKFNSVNIGVIEACSYTLYTKTLNTYIIICNIYKTHTHTHTHTLSLSRSLSLSLSLSLSQFILLTIL